MPDRPVQRRAHFNRTAAARDFGNYRNRACNQEPDGILVLQTRPAFQRVRTLVPPHIVSGTRIVVETADGSYVERAKD